MFIYIPIYKVVLAILYTQIRRIVECFTGFPADHELAREYLWVWKFTGTRPTSIIRNEYNGTIGFRFNKKRTYYSCNADKNNKYYINIFDVDAIFDEEKYRLKAYLINKYLKIPKNCKKEEAVLFCVDAINIKKEHPYEQINSKIERKFKKQYSWFYMGGF